MAKIAVKDLTTSNVNDLNWHLSESELALQGGGFFRRKQPKPAPIPAPVPDILIGFAPISIF